MTSGGPAALRSLPGSGAVAADLARMCQAETASLAPSTLHLFHDLFLLWPARSHALYLDGGLYETARWGAEMAASRGMTVRRFRHHDVSALRRAIQADEAYGLTPVVVTDGFCPDCGSAAPLGGYAGCAEAAGGWLVADDTQAFGVLGRGPTAGAPFGTGGGGTAAWLGVWSRRLIVAASLAKGFGTPMAFAAGERKMMERLERVAETRVHCSPVSAPALHAAESAIAFNEHAGERTRRSLAQLVLRLRRRLCGLGADAAGAPFPAVSVAGTRECPAEELHRALQRMEINTVLQRQRISGRPRVGVLITASHTARDIDRLAGALAGLLAPGVPPIAAFDTRRATQAC